MQDVGQSEALAKQSVKCKKRAFSCEKYGLDFTICYEKIQVVNKKISSPFSFVQKNETNHLQSNQLELN